MPGWHAATLDLQRQGKVRVLGLIEEQHPDRCRLFMQWKKMGWPVLVDSLDLVRIGVVPLTLAIDEHGVIRHVGLRPNQADQLEEMFLDIDYPAPPEETAGPSRLPPEPRTADDWRRAGDSRFLVGSQAEIDATLDAYRRAIELDPADGWSHFRRAVTFRARYDSSQPHADDFQQASLAWARALDIDPNNYIWRRRLQQYGPRLAKPYPFYDWVAKARGEIAARGEEPAPLRVEPSDSEIARPARSFERAEVAGPQPDRAGRIHRDEPPLIGVEWAAVPPRVAAGEALRIHFLLRPDAHRKAHWNNEVDELVLWIDPPAGWQAQRRLLQHSLPAAPLSTETRSLEVELIAPEDGDVGEAPMTAYALYYVCEDVTGTCLYRRQDVDLSLYLTSADP